MHHQVTVVNNTQEPLTLGEGSNPVTFLTRGSIYFNPSWRIELHYVNGSIFVLSLSEMQMHLNGKDLEGITRVIIDQGKP